VSELKLAGCVLVWVGRFLCVDDLGGLVIDRSKVIVILSTQRPLRRDGCCEGIGRGGETLLERRSFFLYAKRIIISLS